MVHLMELKPGVEEKVGDITHTENEELQSCQWCMPFHCLSSGGCAGVCCKENCKQCSKIRITYLLCCFASKGASLISETGECHKWSVPLHAVSFDACMHTCIAVGSMSGSHSILPSCPCSRGGSAYTPLLKPRAHLQLVI